MSLYAVTGASGHLGRLVVEELLDRGVSPSEVVCVVRTPSKVQDLRRRGLEIRMGDYGDPETLKDAFADVSSVLLVSSSEHGNRVPHHTNVIEAARAAGVERIAYTGLLNTDGTSNLLVGEHQGTEEVLRRSGVPFTLLRNGWYIENYTDQLGRYLALGAIFGAAGAGKVSAASRSDYAAAAAAALLADDKQTDVVYELGGPAFNLSELAQIITEVTGTQVVYRDLTVEQYTDALLKGGLDESTARFVAALDAVIAVGDLETDSDDLVRLIGRPVTPVAEVVTAAASRFAAVPASNRGAGQLAAAV
jgi:NAD(P)H dehydrogenase (quinone)